MKGMVIIVTSNCSVNLEATNMFQCSRSMKEYSVGGSFSFSKSFLYGNTCFVVSDDLKFRKHTLAFCKILFLDLGSTTKPPYYITLYNER